MTCKTCGAQLSSRQGPCPRCGAQAKKPSTGLGAMITTCVFVTLSIVLFILTFAFR